MQDIKTNHTSSQNLNPAEHEQVLARSVNQADTLAQALAHADRGATGAPHAPSSQQAATSGWSPEQEQAAEVGREAAAPIVVATNEHALDAAQMAAVMTAQAGGTKPLQEAAAVAAAAAGTEERPLRVIDIGGGCGIHFFQTINALPELALDWRIVELPGMAEYVIPEPKHFWEQ